MFSSRSSPLLPSVSVLLLHRVVNAPNPTDNILGRFCHDRSESRQRLTLAELQVKSKMNPNDIQTRICLSVALYAAGDFEQAKSEMTSLPTFNVMTLGDKSYVKGRFDKAFRRYTQPILEQDVSASNSQEAGTNNAELMMTLVLVDAKSMTPHEWFQCLWTYLVDALFTAGYEREAEEEVQQLDHAHLAALASRYFEKERYSYAAFLCTEAIEKNYFIPSYHTLRGHCHQHLGATDVANEDFQEASSIRNRIGKYLGTS